MIPRRLKIRFTDKFGLDMVDAFVESNALGLGTAYRADDKQVVYVRVRPSPGTEYSILKEQLDAWVKDGLLTYDEQT